MKLIYIVLALFLVTLTLVSATPAPNTYEVWQDTTYDGTPDKYLGLITPFNQGVDVATAYAYSGFSSHMIDPIPEAYKSKVWLYDYEGFSVGMFHNVHAGGNTDWTNVQWDVSVMGTPHWKILGDENHEFTYFGGDLYKGRWNYKSHTDGGVIGFENNYDWVVKIEPLSWEQQETWDVYSADGNVVSLNMDYDAYIMPGDGANEVPEFGVVAAFVVLGLAGLFIYKKRD